MEMSFRTLRRAAIPSSLLLVVFVFVWSCVPKPITDLRVLSAIKVPASDIVLTDDEVSDLLAAWVRRDKVIWKVTLSGDANWIEEVRQHDLNSYAVVVLCERRDNAVFSLGPYFGQVPVTAFGKLFEEVRPSSGTVEYDVYLPEAGRYQSRADPNAPMPDYNLTRGDKPLCLKIAGGAMHGAYGESNEVRLDLGKKP